MLFSMGRSPNVNVAIAVAVTPFLSSTPHLLKQYPSTSSLISIRFSTQPNPSINQIPKMSMASPSKSNHNDRKCKFPSSPSPSTSRPKPRSPKEAQEDTIAIFNAVIEFRSNHGGNIPIRSTMETLFLSVKPCLHEQIASADRLYTRFISLRECFRKADRSGVGPTPFDRTFFDLSAKAWGSASNSKAEEEQDKAAPKTVEEEDASDCASLKHATEQARKLWEHPEQQGLSTAVLPC